MLLHEADVSARPVEVAYRVWRHRERSQAAFLANAEERKRGGASVQLFGSRSARSEPAEQEETVRIWRAGQQVRVEHHGGPRDGYYAVVDGPLWWMWDQHSGAISNEDDPSVGNGAGDEMQLMLNPAPLLSSVRLELTGSAEMAGRPAIAAHGTPRPQDPRHGGMFELHELGAGAQHYELAIDQELGILLSAAAIRDGQPFQKIVTLAIQFDPQFAANTFRFEPPEGEEIRPSWGRDRIRHVTLVEAQKRAPFTVLMPDTVPADWQVQCRLIEASQRPPAPMQLGVTYRSTDGHESISLTQTAAGPTNPHNQIGNEEDWEQVTHNGITLRTRPARWGQAQVLLERGGTCVYLMSDNLTRDQVVEIATKLRAAPSVSSI